MLFNKRPRRHIRIGSQNASDRRPRMILTLVGCCVSLILIIVLTVLLGNHLRDRAEDAADTTTATSPSSPSSALTAGDTLPPEAYDPLTVPVVQSEYIKLSNAAGINWGDTATELKKNGTAAVSLVLYYNNGTVNFRSPVSQSMGFQSVDTIKTNLYEALGVLKVANIYSAGCFYVTFHKEEQAALKQIFREYEAALISEAFDAEISDVTLFDLGLDGSAEAAQLVASVRRLEPDAVLGVALPYSLFDAGDPDSICAAYAGAVDYLALDLSAQSAASLRAALEHLAPVISKYSLRIIVPDTLEGVETILSECGITNWMKVPQ